MTVNVKVMDFWDEKRTNSFVSVIVIESSSEVSVERIVFIYLSHSVSLPKSSACLLSGARVPTHASVEAFEIWGEGWGAQVAQFITAIYYTDSVI